ncbi:hypothetical protein QBE53_13070 [Vallitaleaceae bacterium 9-2]
MPSLIAIEQPFITKKNITTTYRLYKAYRPTLNKSIAKALLFIP